MWGRWGRESNILRFGHHRPCPRLRVVLVGRETCTRGGPDPERPSKFKQAGRASQRRCLHKPKKSLRWNTPQRQPTPRNFWAVMAPHRTDARQSPLRHPRRRGACTKFKCCSASPTCNCGRFTSRFMRRTRRYAVSIMTNRTVIPTSVKNR